MQSTRLVLIHVQALAYPCSCITILMITWILSGKLQNYIYKYADPLGVEKWLKEDVNPWVAKTFACCFIKSCLRTASGSWWVHKIHSLTVWVKTSTYPNFWEAHGQLGPSLRVNNSMGHNHQNRKQSIRMYIQRIKLVCQSDTPYTGLHRENLYTPKQNNTESMVDHLSFFKPRRPKLY